MLQCMPAVLRSIGQSFLIIASESGESLAPAVEGKRVKIRPNRSTFSDL